MKTDGQKTYDSFVSDSRDHHQTFVYVAISKILSTSETNDATVILIEAIIVAQYKSVGHVHDYQDISNDFAIK